MTAALARIEAATGRIEAAARNVAPSGGPGSDPELEARYAELQREAGEALQQIDRLIGALER
ncbi:hypothetical protein [Aurantiacibacter sp. D1-12]|uniref:hypothetical protein n=1 Tax=Aurantiacibacter sp. D1-12 TaxID=2993658 RepID=UPI00237D003F|nr:hypothetical protein [Aurantiacibacter sp. D1-12]MDE1466875.1 hypothetical protein [Aurantiacibacter sp. D1-12]